MNKFEERINEEWEKYQAEKKDEQYPNIMLIGASGSGKSSLINKIFGGNFAKVSDIKPETKGFNKIYYGKKYGSTVNLIDTEGYELGKGDFYYSEVNRAISSSVEGEFVHIIWYCIPVVNERVQEMDLNILSKLAKEPAIRKRVCIVFTKCDEDTEDGDKARALKEAIDVNIDAEDERFCSFETSASKEFDCGLDLPALIQWSANAIDDEDMRNKFIGAQMADLEVKRGSVEKLITAATVTAAGIGATPIPFSDAVLLVPVQVAMMGKIIDIYGVSNLANISLAIVGNTLLSNLGKSLVSNLVKMVPLVGPWVGSVINAGVASTLTGAVGLATSEICYTNVKKYLAGKPVAWDQLFEGDEFSNMVTSIFKQKRS